MLQDTAPKSPPSKGSKLGCFSLWALGPLWIPSAFPLRLPFARRSLCLHVSCFLPRQSTNRVFAAAAQQASESSILFAIPPVAPISAPQPQARLAAPNISPSLPAATYFSSPCAHEERTIWLQHQVQDTQTTMLKYKHRHQPQSQPCLPVRTIIELEPVQQQTLSLPFFCHPRAIPEDAT